MFKSVPKGLVAYSTLTSSVLAIKLKSSYRCDVANQPWCGDASNAEWVDPQNHPVDYFVPNFGTDEEIVTSFSDMKEAEGKWKHELTSTFKKGKGHPVDYFVPNFGLDNEILTSQQNGKEAEAKW
jgi:hypothetical protein